MSLGRHLATLAAATSVCGCTTLASGVAVAPPGVNRYSFRECLLARGFYSPPALTGIALRDWRYRHAQPGRRPDRPEPTRYALLEQKNAVFLRTAAGLIADGLMPAQEFWDGRVADREAPAEAPSAHADPAGHFDDRGLSSPYVQLSAPQQYDYPGEAGGTEVEAQRRPSPGDPRARDWRLNRFLDCYMAPVGSPAAPAARGGHDLSPTLATEDGDDDLEGRLLRGHILLALLTQYGTELVVSHPSRRQVAQAELLLGHVKDAEASLRSASVVMDDAARGGAAALVTATDADGHAIAFEGGKPVVAGRDGKPLIDADGRPKPAQMAALTLADPRGRAQLRLGWVDFTTRLLRVFQVGVDIERIDAQQSLDRAANLVAAFSGHGGFTGILQDGLSGVVTVQKVRIYGDAYLRDARETLAVVRAGTARGGDGAWTYPIRAVAHGWSLWDAEIARSCQVLATVAKKEPSSGTCLPAAPASVK